ncbi:hypothetical protein HNQ10_003787 [Deinococcus metallilatus]|uniref:Uncharacterized protein n=1 Tax=Deinococcus metallilatus TaxID=1211322 RepID=A0ABR6MYB5_9DEIO|nr:hypothetical protein [Deinococcus metallilatus]GMA15175.1 hypothetical protein GCM10025871_15060 [Deinococcus metallilatus]
MTFCRGEWGRSETALSPQPPVSRRVTVRLMVYAPHRPLDAEMLAFLLEQQSVCQTVRTGQVWMASPLRRKPEP